MVQSVNSNLISPSAAFAGKTPLPSINAAPSSSGEEADADEIIAEGTPAQRVQKYLIEKMFGAKKSETALRLRDPSSEKSSAPKKPDREDTVTVSEQALAYYRKDDLEFTVETPEGETLRVRYSREEGAVFGEFSTEVQEAEPLVLDLDGDGLDLTDVRKGEYAVFDITGDGKKENVSWVRPDDGFLAYDRNGNGTIDSGKELFGDQHGAKNGFEELARFDDNNDGVMDSSDSVFNDLRVWSDKNSDGVSQAEELGSLSSYGIDRISLKPDSTSHRVAGNRVEGYSDYSMAGITRKAGEVFLNYIA